MIQRWFCPAGIIEEEPNGGYQWLRPSKSDNGDPGDLQPGEPTWFCGHGHWRHNLAELAVACSWIGVDEVAANTRHAWPTVQGEQWLLDEHKPEEKEPSIGRELDIF